MGVTVRPATRADVPPLADVLARAFHDDPPLAWMLPDAGSRHARVRGAFATLLRAEALPYRAVEVACGERGIVGGAIWFPPGCWPPSRLRQLRSLPGSVRALGSGFGRAAALSRTLTRVHPRPPHWYLCAIGVDPEHQGRRIGGALLRSRLTRADQAGEPAYLETCTADNIAIYQRFGFQPGAALPVPAGAPAHTPMWRAACAGTACM